MTEINENKSTYDEDIHPLIERIHLICTQKNMSMFICVEDSDKSRRTSCVNSKLRSKKISEMYDLNQSWTLDDFLTKVINKAKKEGHSSKFLKAMGVPEDP